MENVVVVTAHQPGSGAGMRLQSSAVSVLMSDCGDAMGGLERGT